MLNEKRRFQNKLATFSKSGRVLFSFSPVLRYSITGMSVGTSKSFPTEEHPSGRHAN